MSTVAVTATSKGHRVWIQGLQAKGITAPRFTVTVDGDAMVVQFGHTEKRKVTQSKGGIIDIVGKSVTQWARGINEAVVMVEPQLQRITILRPITL